MHNQKLHLAGSVGLVALGLTVFVLRVFGGFRIPAAFHLSLWLCVVGVVWYLTFRIVTWWRSP